MDAKRKAFRHEVDDQIVHFKRTTPCVSALSGEKLSFNGGAVADHVREFHKLRDDFLSTTGVEMRSVCVQKVGADSAAFSLVDRALAREWQVYHEEHAVLQWLGVEEHKTKTRNGLQATHNK